MRNLKNITSNSTMSESPTRSPGIRKDPIHNRWVIFSPTRSRRPSDFKSKSPNPNPNPNPNPSCPFCIGNEHECAPEIFRVPEKKPDWNIRVIQNLFPALNRDIQQPMECRGGCGGDSGGGVGGIRSGGGGGVGDGGGVSGGDMEQAMECRTLSGGDIGQPTDCRTLIGCDTGQSTGVRSWSGGDMEQPIECRTSCGGVSGGGGGGVRGGVISGGGDEVVVGFGFHDVVIESPVHSVQLVDLAPEEIGEVLLAYKKRILQILSFDSIQYVQVFKNHGASAGASMSHSHSQIIGLPVVPSLVSARVKSMKEYYEQTGKCSLCEIQSKQLLVDESTHFTSVAPFASAWPFELWIIPREHSSHFHEIDSDKVVDLGGLLKLMLQKISLQLNNPPYNFMIHTSPVSADSSSLSSIHWFVQIIPQLSTTAGFELGTGCYINAVFPEDAAQVLRDVRIPKVDSE